MASLTPAELDQRLREVQATLGAAGAGSGGLAEVDAGPFPGLAEVRAFQAALAGLPGVAEVELRGFEVEDRAVFEVRLGRPGA